MINRYLTPDLKWEHIPTKKLATYQEKFLTDLRVNYNEANNVSPRPG